MINIYSLLRTAANDHRLAELEFAVREEVLVECHEPVVPICIRYQTWTEQSKSVLESTSACFYRSEKHI